MINLCSKIFLFILLLFIPFLGHSQNTFLSVGGEIALPSTEGLSRVAGTGFGASLRLENAWGRHISGIATVGYLWFKSKEIDFISATSRFKAVPVQIGLKYYPWDKYTFGFFLSTEMGIMTTTRQIFYQNADPALKRTHYDISVAPGIGYKIGDVEPSCRLMFNLSDTGFNVYYLNFRVAYSFLKSKG